MQQRNIGRYRVLEEIAAGGQGTVYRAQDTSLNRVVALKVLHPHLAGDASVLERFRREAQMAAAVTHPNITTIYEVGQDGNFHFIAMEFLPQSIHSLIESQGRLPVERAVDICHQAALALQAASNRGIVHRDIKPQNLLLTGDGSVKVTDFGIARAAELSTMTRTGAMMGTPHYMSPEQAQGQRVDVRSDIYSLGIVLYQMLSGQLPFDSQTPFEVMRRHIEERAVPVRQMRTDIPASVDRIVQRCLEKSPAQRYQTPQQLARALQEALPQAGTARQPQQRPASPRPAQRQQRAAAPAPRPARPSRTWMDSWARAWQRNRRSGWPWLVTALSVAAVAAVAVLVVINLENRGNELTVPGFGGSGATTDGVSSGLPAPAEAPPRPTTILPRATAAPPAEAPPRPTTILPRATAAPPAPESRYGNELHLAIAEDPYYANGFLPFENVSSAKREVNSLIFSRLFRDTTSGIVPVLAESWDVSEDFKRWRVYIRDDAQFHSGRPVTAADVKFSIETLQESGLFGRRWFLFDGMTIIDDYTLEIRFSGPFPDFDEIIGEMAQPTSIILPAYIYDNDKLSGDSLDPSIPVGSGPFKQVEWVRGEHLVLERNPHYYEPNLPYVDRIFVHFIPERATRIAAFLTGQIDFLGIPYGAPQGGISRDELEHIVRNRPDAVLGPPPSIPAIWFDTQVPPFDDMRVRWAISYAIDQDILNEALLEGRGEHQGPVPKALFTEWTAPLDDPNARFRGYPYDPDRARELLAEAGYPDGFETQLMVSARWVEWGRVVAQMLAEVGIATGMGIYHAEHMAGIGEFGPRGIPHQGMVLAPFQRFDGDIELFIREHFTRQGTHNYSRWTDAMPREVLLEFGSELDPEKRRELVSILIDHLAEEVVVVPLPAPPAAYARSGRMRGALELTDLGTMMKRVWIEEAAPDTGASASQAGDLLWRYETGERVFSSPTVSEGVVYVGSVDSHVYALDATTGGLLWRYETADRVGSSPTVSTGVVYIGSHDNWLYALDAVTGKLFWRYETGGDMESSPTVSDGIVYVGSDDGRLYALAAATGELLWSYETGGAVESSPTVSDGIVYVGSNETHLYALDAVTGKLFWRYKTGHKVNSSPTVSDGIVYVGSDDGRLYALDAAVGELLWSYETGGDVEPSPTVSDGIVYVGSWDNHLYALDATTGGLLWRYETADRVSSSATVSDGIVYVGSDDGLLYALGAATGELLWRYETGSGVYSSPTVSGGIVYVGSLDNHLYAVKAGTRKGRGMAEANGLRGGAPAQAAYSQWKRFVKPGVVEDFNAYVPRISDFGDFDSYVDDGSFLIIQGGGFENSVVGFRTWLYHDGSASYEVVISGDDGVALYCNGAFIVGRGNAEDSASYGIMELNSGWNKIEALVYNGPTHIELRLDPVLNTIGVIDANAYYGAPAPASGATIAATPTQTNSASDRAALNRPPEAVGRISNQTVDLGDSITLNVSQNFKDPEGDQVTDYGFYLTNPQAASGSSIDPFSGELTLYGSQVGTTVVRVDAYDGRNWSNNDQTFTLTVTVPPTPTPDRAALVAFYHATGGPNWTNSANWLSDAPTGEWHGVTTDGNGRVTELRFGKNQLTGQVPSELGSLANLERLNLKNNRLSGRIPAELGGLTNLKKLDLGYNQLSGKIPPELGSLTNLNELSLEYNQLSGEIPSWLRSLTNLQSLDLTHNKFTGEIPPRLASLTNLTQIYIGGNQLSGEIPSWLGRLTNLRWLGLGSNELTGEIPPELGRLTNLEGITLVGNELNGEIPSWLGSLTNLQRLDLSYNQLVGEIPPELGNLTSLTSLILQGNQVSGEIPSWLGTLTGLRGLYLSKNQLSGEIPPELGNLTNLKWLHLDRNMLNGKIPPDLGRLTNLQKLYLSDNQLSGCLPADLGSVTDNDFSELGLPFCAPR